MNASKSDLISDPDVGKPFKYYAQYPRVMQGSQEGKRAKLWGPRVHFGANISMKIEIRGKRGATNQAVPKTPSQTEYRV